MSHHGDGASLLMGFAGVLIGKLLGWIAFASVAQAFVLGCAGAAGGWLTKLLLEAIIKQIKLLIQKIKTKTKI